MLYKTDISKHDLKLLKKDIPALLQQEKIYKDSSFKDPPGVEAETLLPPGSEEPCCWWAPIQTIAENDYSLTDLKATGTSV